MLKQWGKQVLTEWVQVYTLLLPKMSQSSSSDDSERLEKECIDIVMKMTDMQQPNSVRISATHFLG